MKFREWLLLEEIESNLVWAINNLKRTITVPDTILDMIRQALKVRNVDGKSYISYLFGFYRDNKDARIEDYEKAIDNYNYYERHKRNPEMVEAIRSASGVPLEPLTPFLLGTLDRVIENIRVNPQSRSQQKRLAKTGEGLSEDRLVVEDFGKYQFITIPAATNPKEEQENKAMYCKYGEYNKTSWCTAMVSGDYYKHYVNILDITIIKENGEPVYQFGLQKGKINNLSQFQDDNNRAVGAIGKTLYKIIASNPKYKDILNLDQFVELEKIKNKKKIDFKNTSIYEIRLFGNYNEYEESQIDQMEEQYIKYLIGPKNGVINLANRLFYRTNAEYKDKDTVKLESFNTYKEMLRFLRSTGAKVDDFSFLDEYQEIQIDISRKEATDYLDESLPNNIETKIEKYLDDNKPEDIDEENWEEMSLSEKCEIVNDSIIDAVERALYNGYEVGTQSKYAQDVISQLGTKDENGFYISDMELLIKADTLYELLKEKITNSNYADEILENGLDLTDFVGITYSGDDNGYSLEFDKAAFLSSLEDELAEIID